MYQQEQVPTSQFRVGFGLRGAASIVFNDHFVFSPISVSFHKQLQCVQCGPKVDNKRRRCLVGGDGTNSFLGHHRHPSDVRLAADHRGRAIFMTMLMDRLTDLYDEGLEAELTELTHQELDHLPLTENMTKFIGDRLKAFRNDAEAQEFFWSNRLVALGHCILAYRAMIENRGIRQLTFFEAHGHVINYFDYRYKCRAAVTSHLDISFPWPLLGKLGLSPLTRHRSMPVSVQRWLDANLHGRSDPLDISTVPHALSVSSSEETEHLSIPGSIVYDTINRVIRRPKISPHLTQTFAAEFDETFQSVEEAVKWGWLDYEKTEVGSHSN